MKTLYFDLDGSLLDHIGVITTQNLLAVKNYMRYGGKVGLVTGRSYLECRQYIDQIQPNMPCFLLNGNQLYEKQRLYTYFDFPYQLYLDFYKENQHIYYFVEEYGDYYLPQTRIAKKFFTASLGISSQKFRSERINDIEKPICVYIMNQNGKDVDQTIDDLMKNENVHLNSLLSSFHVTKMNNYWFKAYNNAADKVICLEYINEHYSISKNNVMFFANDENDMKMFRKVGKRIALSDAVEPICKIAHRIIDNNEIAAVIMEELE